MILEMTIGLVSFMGLRGIAGSNTGKKLLTNISTGIDSFFGNEDCEQFARNTRPRKRLLPSENQFKNDINTAIDVEYKEIISNLKVEDVNHFKKAMELIKAREFNKAIEQLNIHVKLYPDQAGAYIQLSLCHQYLGELDKAIDSLEKALLHKKDIKNGYSMLGKLYNEKGNYIKAIDFIQKGVEQNPTTSAYYQLAKAYFNKGDCKEEAIKYCDYSLELDKNNFEVYALKANIYIEDEKLDEAIKFISSALEINNVDEKLKFRFMLLKCSIYCLMGEYELALKACEKAKEIDSGAPIVLLYKVFCLIAKGEYLEGKNILDTIGLNHELTYICYGYLNIGLGEPTLAIDNFNEALKLNNKNAESYNGLYIAYYVLGRAGAAELNLEKSLHYKIKGQNFIPLKGVKVIETPEVYVDKYNIDKYRYTAGTKFILHCATDKDGVKVAIKELNDYFASQQLFVDLFRKEIELIKDLKHPNIVRILDFGFNQYNDRYYTIMPLMKYNLYEYIQRVSIAEKDIINISLQILAGLQYFHQYNSNDSKPLVHRELKPSEVLIDFDGTVKISDFANAKVAATFTSQSGASISRVDTDALYYIAPERLQGKKTDLRSDIYSVGALMYFMVTGQHPYYTEKVENNMQRIMRIMKSQIIQPKEINSSISTKFNNIILKALSRDIINRCQSDNELIDELKELL